MEKGDVLLKKWCFGVSFKPKEWLQVSKGNAQVFKRFPRYRTIALKILSAEEKGKNTWEVEAERYASLTAKPKKVKVSIKKTSYGAFAVEGQKRVYHKISPTGLTEEGMPPVGSLVFLNRRHAIVCDVGRNEMTVFLDGKYMTVNVVPGTIKWREDKIIASLPNS